MTFITSNIVGPVDGGIMVSHGALAVLALWFFTAKARAWMRSKG